ncbi:MAG: superoxide dismutase family protein [Hyphomonadaceae bacterium]
MSRFFISVFSVLLLAACGQSSTAEKAAEPAAETPAPDVTAAQYVGQTLTNPIMSAAGAEIGRATLTEGPHGVLIRLDFNAGALSPGWHGLHFHERGTCDDGSAGFTASGAHVGHGEGTHGLLNSNGPEPGDLPSIFAPERGAFGAEVYTSMLRLGLGEGVRPAIADADGSALVIHASHDDQATQPIGGAGARVACVVFNAG